MSSHPPDLDAQRRFWDEWNHDYREHGLDEFMEAQLAEAIAALPRMRERPPRILELGCGNGWLSYELGRHGDVVGIDISPLSIARARQLYPDVRFEIGDFSDLSEPGPFDYIVSADVIAHLARQAEFIQLAARLLRPGGTFLLMTQNRFVWNRSSYLAPQGEGQIRDWPSLGKVKALMAPYFEIARIDSIVPGGDQGILKLLNSRLFLKILRTGLGWRRSTALYQKLRIGRELVIVGIRRPTSEATSSGPVTIASAEVKSR